MFLSLDCLVCSANCFLYTCFIPSHVWSKIYTCLFLMYQADSWEDTKDDAGNTLHILKLEYKTKHGKKPDSYMAQVFPRDVNSALCLVVNLFLEQPKVNDEDHNNHDSLMKLFKTSAVNERLHENSFGKVSSFLSQIN
jgi:hypothetical protein